MKADELAMIFESAPDGYDYYIIDRAGIISPEFHNINDRGEYENPQGEVWQNCPDQGRKISIFKRKSK